MKLIGRTPTGGVILDAELIEYLTLIEAGRSLAILPVAEFATSAPAEASQPGRQDAVPPKTRKGRAVLRTAVTAAKKKTQGERICLVCEKPLTGSLRGGRKAHKGKCSKTYHREQSLKRWRKKYGVKHPRKGFSTIGGPASGGEEPNSGPSSVVRRLSSVPNPADPTLTDEEREQIRAERLDGMMKRRP